MLDSTQKLTFQAFLDHILSHFGEVYDQTLSLVSACVRILRKNFFTFVFEISKQLNAFHGYTSIDHSSSHACNVGNTKLVCDHMVQQDLKGFSYY